MFNTFTTDNTYYAYNTNNAYNALYPYLNTVLRYFSHMVQFTTRLTTCELE